MSDLSLFTVTDRTPCTTLSLLLATVLIFENKIKYNFKNENVIKRAFLKWLGSSLSSRVAPPWKGKWGRWYSFLFPPPDAHSFHLQPCKVWSICFYSSPGSNAVTLGLSPSCLWTLHCAWKCLSLGQSEVTTPNQRVGPLFPLSDHHPCPSEKNPYSIQRENKSPCFISMCFPSQPLHPHFSSWQELILFKAGEVVRRLLEEAPGKGDVLLSPQITHRDCLFCTKTDLKTSQFWSSSQVSVGAKAQAEWLEDICPH